MFKKLFTFGVFITLLLLFLFPVISTGQEEYKPMEESPQEMQREMNVAMQGMRQMGPAMKNMMTEMLDEMFSYMAKKETTVKLATFTRNYYVALVKAGFTKEEAMQIVVQSGFPRVGSR